jgi:hypothetical protein
MSVQHSGLNLGTTLSEQKLKQVLTELNPEIHFDMGAALNLTHPRIDEWQGVFWKGRHVTSMSRGVLPEFDMYQLVRRANGEHERGRIEMIGWRNTLESIVRQNIPGVTWESLCPKLGVDRKKFTGNPMDLVVA